ncbi:MAG: phosphoserine transaminase [Propionibacteriales bacterium]|nr:phosphoserine transaminase [Propionibacteriales bacterium]
MANPIPTGPIPPGLLPRDGRFGSGPAKIRDEALDALRTRGRGLLGTSHRQAPVRGLVGRVRAGLSELLALPEGYEIVLGNGGSTVFWDIAAYSLINNRSSHGVYGEFSAKFARAASAPHLAAPLITEGTPGAVALPERAEGVDAYAWAHNETSTGALAPVQRIPGAEGALMIIDGTSAAGGVEVDLSQSDAYYFAPQKCLGSDGGLWLAALSPAALDRAAKINSSGRWIPQSLDLQAAIENSRLEQTVNTPALATLFLLAEQVDWFLAHGGLRFAADRSRRSSDILYRWAENSPVATPFVAEPHRSPVVVTIDFDADVDAAELAARLRANGVVDTEPYRKLGRNQLRIGTYPTVEPSDVEALTRCLDWLLDHPES